MMYIQSSDSHGVYDDADNDQGGSTNMMIYYENKRYIFQSSNSHGVYDNADNDQGHSIRMMIYYEKQKMMMQITYYDFSFSYHEIDTTYDCFCNLMS